MDWYVTEVKPQGEHLHELALFEQVAAIDGVVTWPGELDLAPDAMHDEIRRSGQWVLS